MLCINPKSEIRRPKTEIRRRGRQSPSVASRYSLVLSIGIVEPSHCHCPAPLRSPITKSHIKAQTRLGQRFFYPHNAEERAHRSRSDLLLAGGLGPGRRSGGGAGEGDGGGDGATSHEEGASSWTARGAAHSEVGRQHADAAPAQQ